MNNYCLNKCPYSCCAKQVQSKPYWYSVEEMLDFIQCAREESKGKKIRYGNFSEEIFNK